jgi:hypothetical protein
VSLTSARGAFLRWHPRSRVSPTALAGVVRPDAGPAPGWPVESFAHSTTLTKAGDVHLIPTAGHHGRPPHPCAGPITDGRRIPAPITDRCRPIPAPRRSRTAAAPSRRRADHGPLPPGRAPWARAYMRKSAGAREVSEDKPSPRAYLDRPGEARRVSRDKPSAWPTVLPSRPSRRGSLTLPIPQR